MAEGSSGIFDTLKHVHRRFLPEGERRSSHFIDLTDGKEQAVELLRQEVAASHGEIRVVVHPYFTAQDDRYPITHEYLGQLAMFLDDSQTQPRPLVIFEEEAKVSELKHAIGEKAPAFVVRTAPKDPTPATKAVKASMREEGGIDYHVKQRANEQLGTLFEQAGVTSTLIAGRYLFDHSGTFAGNEYNFGRFVNEASAAATLDDWKKQGVFPTGCVAEVIDNFLRKGIEVSVSPAVSPALPQSLLADRHSFLAR